VIKSKNQLLFPTSSTHAEDPYQTTINTVMLDNSSHGDVGATSQIALQWMIKHAKNSGVKMHR
jgi:hypothetical protein